VIKTVLKLQMKRRVRKPRPSNAASISRGGRVSVRTGAPVAMGRRLRIKDPSISAKKSGAHIVVSHRELAGPVFGSIAFSNILSLYLQPGYTSQTPFTWLPGIATLYESYQILKMEFQYEPMCPSSCSGAVIMAIDYDVSDPNPSSVDQIATYHNASRSNVWQPSVMRYDSSADVIHGRRYYVRGAAQPMNTDLKEYDSGAFYCAVYGSDAASNGNQIGEVWVNYTVAFYTPQINTAMPVDPGSAVVISADTGVSTSNMFGPTPIIRGDTGLASVVGPASLLLRRAGEYFMGQYFSGAGSLATTVPTYTLSPATGGTITTITAPRYNILRTDELAQYKIKTTEDNVQLNWTNLTDVFPAGLAQTYLDLIPAPSAYV